MMHAIDAASQFAIDATFSHAGRCYRTRDYDDGKARRYIPGITDEENALVDEHTTTTARPPGGQGVLVVIVTSKTLLTPRTSAAPARGPRQSMKAAPAPAPSAVPRPIVLR